MTLYQHDAVPLGVSFVKADPEVKHFHLDTSVFAHRRLLAQVLPRRETHGRSVALPACQGGKTIGGDEAVNRIHPTNQPHGRLSKFT